MGGKWKLKDPHVCRIFFSSPFNGMEGEREALTSQYWPRIQSLCNSHGIQFVPVDMRWGITLEHSAQSQTINICLREIDRSDMFVGFFGQRYGWQGVDDEALQKSFEAAMPSYPWLSEYRDRSVTELEFLHGHLLNQGLRPSYICFRDKAFDDQFREEGLAKGDKRMIYKFSSESELATELMNDLKHRVKESEQQCVGVNMAYPTPAQGAKLMYEAIMKVLTEELLESVTTETRRSLREQELAHHVAFCDTRCGIYVGGEAFSQTLHQHVKQGSSTPILIVGEPGSGKSALLCNWVRSMSGQGRKEILVYHFIGCTPQSCDPSSMLRRLIQSLLYHHWRQDAAKSAELSAQQQLDRDDEMYRELQEFDEDQLVLKFKRTLDDLTRAGYHVVLVVDGLNRIVYKSVITKPLYWIPKTFPAGVTAVFSTQTSDSVTLEELVEARKYVTMEISPITIETKTTLCKEVLMLRGKELSSDQLGRVVRAERTENPLFLNIALEELCSFGRFRDLDKKLDTLVGSESSIELFGHFLERLEKDYNTEDYEANLVEQVVCALLLSRCGWEEAELCDMLEIHSHQWAPLYYALEKYLSNNGGLLGIAYPELEEAIYDKYIPSETEKRQFLHIQQDYRLKEYKRNVQAREGLGPVKKVLELLWVCYSLEDRYTLLKLVSFIPLFLRVEMEDPYELLQYIQFLDLAGDRFIDIYDKALDDYMAMQYSIREENGEDPNPIKEVKDALHNIYHFLSMAKNFRAQESCLKRKMALLEKNKKGSSAEYQHALYQAKYDMACLHVDQSNLDAALPIHTEVYEYFEKQVSEKGLSEDKRQLAMCCNGLGTLHLKRMKELEKAEAFLKRSCELHCQLPEYRDHKVMDVIARTNLAQVHMLMEKYELAIQELEQVVETEQQLYVTILPPECSYSLTNLGICYRYVKEWEKARKVYERAMHIKVTALGEIHNDVAVGCYNFGKLAIDMEEYEEAERHFKQAVSIFEQLSLTDAVLKYMAYECIVLVFLRLERFEEAEQYFWKYFDWRATRPDQDVTYHPFATMAMVDVLFQQKAYDKVRKASPQLIRVGNLRHPRFYYYLHECNRLDPRPDGSSQIPKDVTLDAGLEIFPGSRILVETKVSCQLAPEKNLEAVVALLERYYLAPEDDTDAVLYTTSGSMAEHCPEHIIAFYEHWRPKFPQSRLILRNLGIEYYKAKQFPESLDCFQAASDLEPDDPALIDKVALTSLMSGLTTVTRAAVEELERRWPENQELMAMAAKYKSFVEEIEVEQAKQENGETS